MALSKLLKVCCWLLAFAILPAQAQELYRVDAAAQGQLVDDQRAAFDLLLLRLTGDNNSHNNPLVMKAKQNINPYVQQYSYHEQLISVLFNEKAVNQLLKQANLRLWGNLRPQIVVWFAYEADFERQLLAARDEVSWRNSMGQQAERLAIPLLFPVMDLEDNMALSVNDVWGQFDQPVFTASQRYASPLVLTVRQYQQGASWQAQWRLLDSQSHTQLDSGMVSGSLEQVAGNMVSDLAPRLAQRYGIILNDALDTESAMVTVSNLNNMGDFVRLEQFLQQQAMVANVQLQQVAGTDYVFALELLSSVQDLQAALALAPQLQADELDSQRYHYIARGSALLEASALDATDEADIVIEDDVAIEDDLVIETDEALTE